MKKERFTTNTKVFIAVLVVLFIIGGLANLQSSQTPSKQSVIAATDTPAPTDTPTPDTDLNVTAHTFEYSSGVEVVNNDNTDLSDCTLAINGEGLSMGYTYHDPLIDKKGDTTIPYSWFTKDDGTRFDIGATAVKGLYISCNENGQLKSTYFGTKN